jgi:cytochrome o ubiquinol oxidase subunit IV
MSVEGDLAPGYESQSEEGEGREGIAEGVRSYVLGLALAIALTVASFWVARTHILYGPSVPVALVALAVAQMGIHLVFFLHITTAPDNTNNVLALALGVLIVFVLVFGTVWVMAHMNHNMMSMHEPMAMSPQNE